MHSSPPPRCLLPVEFADMPVGDDLYPCDHCGADLSLLNQRMHAGEPDLSTVCDDMPAQCPDCGQRYMLNFDASRQAEIAADVASAAKMTAPEIFARRIEPILKLLAATCNRYDFAVLTLAEPSPETYSGEVVTGLQMSVAPFSNQMVPASIHHTMNTLHELGYLAFTSDDAAAGAAPN